MTKYEFLAERDKNTLVEEVCRAYAGLFERPIKNSPHHSLEY